MNPTHQSLLFSILGREDFVEGSCQSAPVSLCPISLCPQNVSFRYSQVKFRDGLGLGFELGLGLGFVLGLGLGLGLGHNETILEAQ